MIRVQSHLCGITDLNLLEQQKLRFIHRPSAELTLGTSALGSVAPASAPEGPSSLEDRVAEPDPPEKPPLYVVGALGAVVVVEDGHDGGVLLHGGPGGRVALDSHAVGAVVPLAVVVAPAAAEGAQEELPHASARKIRVLTLN